MVKVSSKGGTARRFLALFALGAVFLGGAARSQAQSSTGSTVEERLAAMEARIQQLEGELAAARGATPSVVPVSASGSGLQGAFIRPAVLTTSTGTELASAPAAQDAAAAATPTPTPDFVGDLAGLNFFKGVQFGGFLDTYYMYDFNAPSSMKIDPGQSRNFDLNHNSLTLSQVDFELTKAASETSPLGYMVQTVFGSTANLVNSGDLAPVSTGNSSAITLMQYYMTLRAPGKRGVTVDFGKFVTPMGEEVIDNRANWNYSRGLLFSLAIPYYHFGGRVTLPVSSKLSVTGFLVNGWNNVTDNNGGKTGGVSVGINTAGKLGIVVNYLGGPEQPASSNKRNMFDTVLTAKLGSKITFVENFDYGMDKSAADESHAHWLGTASYLRLQPSAKFALTPRFEFYSDPNGFTTGARQQMKEFTLTPEFTLHTNLIARIEYRHDWSTAPSFVVEDPSTGDMFRQNTFGAGMIFKF